MIRNRLGASARGTPRVPPVAAGAGLPQTIRFLVASQVISGGTVTIDFRIASRYELLLDTNVTTLNVIAPNLQSDQCMHLSLLLKQDGVGSRIITNYTGDVFFPGGGANPVLSTTPNWTDVLAAIANGRPTPTQQLFVQSTGFPTPA